MSVRTKPLLITLVILLVGVGGVALGRTWGQHSVVTTSTTTSTTTSVPVAPSDAIWPFASSNARFTDPISASFAFARDYLGFASPVVSTVWGSVNGTANVAVRPAPNGMVTTVALERSRSTATWWVVGASTPTIVVTTPTRNESITNPVTVSWPMTATDACCSVTVTSSPSPPAQFQDGSLTPLARATVMGGGSAMGPFNGTIHFATPTASSGSVMFREQSAKDGSYVAATVVRVGF